MYLKHQEWSEESKESELVYKIFINMSVCVCVCVCVHVCVYECVHRIPSGNDQVMVNGINEDRDKDGIKWWLVLKNIWYLGERRMMV